MLSPYREPRRRAAWLPLNRLLPWQAVARVAVSPPGSVMALTVAAIVCGLAVERFALSLAVIAALVLLVGALWPRLFIIGLRASLEFEREQAAEGEIVGATLSVTNRWPVPAWGLVLSGLSEADVQPVVALGPVRPWSTEVFHWPLLAPYRGVFPPAHPVLSTRFPFGLATGARPVRCPIRLKVAPRSFPIEVEFAAGEDLPWDQGQRPKAAGGHGDMVGVRPYRVGDSLRRIHWAQTARHDTLIVCEREAMVRPTVELLADLSPEAHTGGPPDASLEWTLRITLSLCRSIVAAGGRVHCHLGDRHFDLPASRGSWQSFVGYLTEVPRQGVAHADSKPTGGRAGRLELVIATDRSRLLQKRDSRSGRQLLIVLRSGAFPGQAPSDDLAPGQPRDVSRCVTLDAPDQVPAQLVRGLRREVELC